MTKTAIINETIEYYSADVSRRSVNNEGCWYQSEKDGINTYCAVGRCMNDALKKFRDFKGGVNNMIKSCPEETNIDSLVKDEYKGHALGFWSALQRFHDDDFNWEETGISTKGKSEAFDLFRAYAN